MTPVYEEIRSVINISLLRTTMKKATQVDGADKLHRIASMTLSITRTIKEQMR